MFIQDLAHAWDLLSSLVIGLQDQAENHYLPSLKLEVHGV